MCRDRARSASKTSGVKVSMKKLPELIALWRYRPATLAPSGHIAFGEERLAWYFLPFPGSDVLQKATNRTDVGPPGSRGYRALLSAYEIL